MDEVSIHRKLPDTLLIQVTESYPVAALCAGGEYWLLDARCKLLERGDASLAQGKAEVLGLTPLAPAVGTPLAVDQSQQDKLASLKSLLSAIQARGMTGSVTAFIDLRSDNEIRFRYGADLTVVMPMNDDFTDRTYALKRALETMDERGVALHRYAGSDLWGGGGPPAARAGGLPSFRNGCGNAGPSSTPETGLDTQGDTPT